MKNDLVAAMLAACEAGFAMTQAMLAAVDEGLGVCLHAFNPEGVKDVLKAPDYLIPIWVLEVGYPAEDPLTGGQRPREPPAQTFFFGSFPNPIPSDPKVVEYLREKKKNQTEDPRPPRMQKVVALSPP